MDVHLQQINRLTGFRSRFIALLVLVLGMSIGGLLMLREQLAGDSEGLSSPAAMDSDWQRRE